MGQRARAVLYWKRRNGLKGTGFPVGAGNDEGGSKTGMARGSLEWGETRTGIRSANELRGKDLGGSTPNPTDFGLDTHPLCDRVSVCPHREGVDAFFDNPVQHSLQLKQTKSTRVEGESPSVTCRTSEQVHT